MRSPPGDPPPPHGPRLRPLSRATGLTEPRTAAELLPLLPRCELDTHQLGFAIGEALAHLNFLEADGLVRFGKR